MVEYLRKVAGQATIRPRNFFWLSVVLVASGVSAQTLPDPTRPPASLAPVQEGVVAAPTGSPVLQSTIVAPDRRIAVINGQAVRLGEKYGDARVIKITETEVVLKNGTELQTLKLFPSIEKRTAPGSAAAKSDSGRR